MALLASWKESLEIFYPRNFKTFALLTFNAWVKAWKVVWPYAFGVLGAMFILSWLQGGFVSVWGFSRIIDLWRPMLIVLFLAAVRPSVGLKDVTYYRSLALKLMILAVLPWVTVIVGEQLVASVPMYLWQQSLWTLYYICNILLVLLVWHVGAYAYVFFSLFLLDMPMTGWYRAVKNTFVFFVYNAPVCWMVMLLELIVFGTAFLSLSRLTYSDQLQTLVSIMVWVLLTTLFLALWTNIYIKRVRDNPNLYV